MNQTRWRWGNFADLAVRYCLYLAIILLPLIYWDGLGGPYTIAKVTVLWILAAWGTFFWVLRTILWDEGWRIVQMPLVFPLLALVVSFVISSFFSINSHLSVFGTYYRKEGLLTFLAYISFFPMTATTMRSRADIRTLLEALVLAAGLCGFIAISQILGWGIGPASDEGRVTSTFGNANFAGQFYAMSSIAALGLMLLFHKSWKKLLALLAFGLSLLVLLETFTRGAWVSFFITLALLFPLGVWGLLPRNRTWIVSIAIFMAVALFLAYSLAGTENYSFLSRLESFFSEQIFDSRLPYWEQGISVAENNLAVGSGPETLRLAFRPFKTEAYLAGEASESAQKYSNLDRAHNELIDIAASRGLIGLAAFAFFLVSLILLWRQYRRRAKDRYTRGLLAIPLAIWAAYLLANLFGFGMAATTPLFWIFGGSIAGFTFVLPRPKPDAEEEGSDVPETKPVSLGKGYLWLRLSLIVLVISLAVLAVIATRQSILQWSADYAYGQSIFARQQGAEELAVELNERATELYPEEGQYWLGLGLAKMDLALTQTNTIERALLLGEARFFLDKGRPMTDQPEGSWNNIGISYWHEAECWGPLDTDRLTVQSRALLEKARDNFIACTQFDQTLPQSWLFLSQVDNLLGHWQEAGDAATRVLKIDPESIEAYLSITKAEIGLGDTSSARHYLDILLEKDPQNEEGNALLEELAKSP